MSDRVLSNFEIGFFDYLAKEYEKVHPNNDAIAFEDATRGLATISTNIGNSILNIIGESTNSSELFFINQNYPNPFNPSTTISYTLPEESNVTINIYNLLGNRVARIFSSIQPLGTHSIQWNGTDQQGNQVPTGIYFYQLQAGDFVQTKKMVLMR